jgi:hypothetical protein
LYGEDYSQSRLSYGDDVLKGGVGDDSLFGERGSVGGSALPEGRLDNDTLTSTRIVDADASGAMGGDDALRGGPGDDQLYGDLLFANPDSAGAVVGGDDTLRGGQGTDSLYGDRTDGGLAGGADRVFGEYGDDGLNVEDGDDLDHADGGVGNDACLSDPGDTVLNCEA